MQASHLVAFCLVLFCTLKLASPVLWPSSENAPAIGNWTIKDSKGNICQQMQFAASYTVKTGYTTPKTVAIDPSRAYAKGDCNAYRSIVVFLNDDKLVRPKLWWLKMIFNKTDTVYNLATFNVSWVDASGDTEYTVEVSSNYWNRCVTMGSAYNCTMPFAADYRDVTINIWNQYIQPYAEDTKGGFGPSQYCTDKPPGPANCGTNDFDDVSYARRKETKALGYDLL